MSSGKKRWVVVASIVGPLLLAAGWLAALHNRKPPLQSLASAYRALDSARAAGAERQAYSLLTEAEQFLSRGEKALQAENASWWPFGSYRLADSLLTLATQRARTARQACVSQNKTRSEQVKSLLASTRQDFAGWRERVSGELVPLDCQHLLTKAGTSLNLAAEVVQSGHYEEAESLLQQVDSLLIEVKSHYDTYRLQNEEQLEHWQALANETREHSRKTGQAAIIVDKSAHKLYLIEKGQVAATYPCELGFSSARQKRMAGDGATPEGKYLVTEVKQYSKYYKALLLDYPNEADRRRFQQNQREGGVPADAKIGGLIEIHGDGGRPEDWTDGCVAVTNEHMDSLMKHARKGMWVTIVRMAEPAP